MYVLPTKFNVQTWKMCRQTKRFSTPAGNPDFGMTRSTCRSKFAYAATSRNTYPGSRPLNSAVFCDLPLIIPHDLVQRSIQHMTCFCIFTCLNFLKKHFSFTFFTCFTIVFLYFYYVYTFYMFTTFYMIFNLSHVLQRFTTVHNFKS